MFTSGPSSPHLTIDQANSLYKLATECQALGVKLAKKFQVLSGLEAMHHNPIQGMVHETLTLGHSAQEATYSAIMQYRVPDDEHEATTHCLCSEADVTWKEMHEVMYSHQLHYDGQLATFLVYAEMALDDMRGEVWDAIRALAENEGITFDACLGLMLQMLNLLPQIPIGISFLMQIPLTITYCPESSVYRRWHPEQGGVSPLHKEIRVSCTLSKVLGGVTHQPSESVGGPSSPVPSDHSTGSGWSLGSRHQSCGQAQSVTPACSWQSGSAGSVASHHSIHSHATEDGEVSSNESDSSQDEEDGPEEEDNAKEGKGRIETSSDGQEASDGEDQQKHPHTQDTLTGVSQFFSKHEDTDPESDPRETVQSAWQKWCQDSPKEDSPKKDSSRSSSSNEEPPTDEALHDGARQKAQLLDTCFDAWHYDKIANGVTGWAMQDTMICDLPELGKMQPNHSNPVGPPLDYMAECSVFDGIQSDLYNLCCFYILGMTGNLPEFPVPWELVTRSQIRDLLKSAQSIGCPYTILVHSANSVMAMWELWELHMDACLRCLQWTSGTSL